MIGQGAWSSMKIMMCRFLVLAFSFLGSFKIAEVTAVGKSSFNIAKLIESAERGDQQVQLQLGTHYRDGKVVPQDYQAALKWYRRAADQGNAEGLDIVGFMYLMGWGVPANFDIAIGYFKASAFHSHSQGQFNLGNCYFSGQGVEQSYEDAIAAWQLAAENGNENATWRLATLYSAGESLPKDQKKAERLCRQIAEQGNLNGALLLGELLSKKSNAADRRKWWKFASRHGSQQAKDLLELEKWRWQPPIARHSAFVNMEHLYQGWNNCGATSIAMFARHFGADLNPYEVKRLCPQNPIGTGTDWADLLAVSNVLNQKWKMLTFANTEQGFAKGIQSIQQHLDAGNPVVIDFTVLQERNGKQEKFGHTLLVVGYNTKRDQFVLKNPNQPPPGIELMSAKELQASWYSSGYSRLAEGQAARPLIVTDRD